MKTLEFDFVVVGGGAAGCVLAARLAQDTEASVALIERGRRDRNPWIHIPATFFKAIQSRDVEAQTSEPDPSVENRPFVVPQARVLGGGTSVNGMIYMRGQAHDYDDWVHTSAVKAGVTPMSCRCLSVRSGTPDWVAIPTTARPARSWSTTQARSTR